MLKGFLFMSYDHIVKQTELFPTDKSLSIQRKFTEVKEVEKAKSGRQIKDLTGQRFGILTVEELTQEVHAGRPVFICRCDCGHFIRATGAHLTGSAVPLTHCGCKGITKSKKIRPGALGIGAYNSILRAKNNPNMAFNALYANYRHGAIFRNIQWRLSEGEFLALIQGDCTYCGAKPEQVRTRGVHAMPYNGIDRVDSSQGYFIENCVPCCGVCNVAKMDHDVGEFLEWVERVHNHQEKVRACR